MENNQVTVNLITEYYERIDQIIFTNLEDLGSKIRSSILETEHTSENVKEITILLSKTNIMEKQKQFSQDEYDEGIGYAIKILESLKTNSYEEQSETIKKRCRIKTKSDCQTALDILDLAYDELPYDDESTLSMDLSKVRSLLKDLIDRL